MKFNEINFEKTTPTTAKNKARKTVTDLTYEMYVEMLGAENVSRVGDSEISICIGTRTDSDGFDREVCVNIAPTAKEVEDRATTKQGVLPAYDRAEAEAEYIDKIKDRDAKKEIKEKQKKANEKKLKEAKAKKLAEKQAQMTKELEDLKSEDTDESTD